GGDRNVDVDDFLDVDRLVVAIQGDDGLVDRRLNDLLRLLVRRLDDGSGLLFLVICIRREAIALRIDLDVLKIQLAKKPVHDRKSLFPFPRKPGDRVLQCHCARSRIREAGHPGVPVQYTRPIERVCNVDACQPDRVRKATPTVALRIVYAERRLLRTNWNRVAHESRDSRSQTGRRDADDDARRRAIPQPDARARRPDIPSVSLHQLPNPLAGYRAVRVRGEPVRRIVLDPPARGVAEDGGRARPVATRAEPLWDGSRRGLAPGTPRDGMVAGGHAGTA